jgi:diaminopimelate decarboxylase
MQKLLKHYIKPRWDYLGQDNKGVLTIEDIPVTTLTQKFGTPLYVLVERSISEKLQRFKKAFPYPKLRVQYASKCNSNLEILKVVNQEGVELDASSVGEIILALLADFEPHEITFTNLYKTEQDIIFAARVGVQAITADSIEDIIRINAAGQKLKQKIRTFLRFNPIIDLGSYTTRHLQYGIPYHTYKKAVDLAMKSPFVDPIGLHFHGSYIINPKVYFLAARQLFKIAEYFLKDYNHKIKFIDLGGGFPVPAAYNGREVFQPEDMGKEFVNFFMRQVHKIGLPLPTLIFEPGKFVVAHAGIGLVKVISKKKTGRTRTLIVDGSTYAFLPDPLIYHCHYDILPATKINHHRQYDYRISGCTCDSIDIISKKIYLPRTEVNDLLAVMDCGAYSNTMASNFNSLKRAPMVMIKQNGSVKLVRRRDRYSDMFAPELDVLKVADPQELKRYYNLLRVNMDKLWGEKKRKR